MNGDGVSVEVVIDLHAEVGEGPVWVPESSELLWVDMAPGLLQRTSYPGGSTVTKHTGTFLGAVAPRTRGGFVAATDTGFALIDDDGTLTSHPALLDSAHRMNDAKCDPHGRLWSGSTARDFSSGQGGVLVLDANWSSRVVLTGLTLPNGMGWSTDGGTYYLADSLTHELFAFDVSADAELSRKRAIHTFSDTNGMPDGLCVDSSGCVWVALWGGSAVVCIAPDGERLRTIELPATQTSSCAFGGPSNDVLFVTSASAGLGGEGRNDGALFAVHGLGVTGADVARFAG